MKNRCDNPNAVNYAHYGGRGITYDPRWRDFRTFYADMKRRPSSKHTLWRVDTTAITRNQIACGRRSKSSKPGMFWSNDADLLTL